MALKEIRKRVMLCTKDTTMANAFRRALGLPIVVRRPRRGAVISVDAYADLEWCMANHGSPLDGRL